MISRSRRSQWWMYTLAAFLLLGEPSVVYAGLFTRKPKQEEGAKKRSPKKKKRKKDASSIEEASGGSQTTTNASNGITTGNTTSHPTLEQRRQQARQLLPSIAQCFSGIGETLLSDTAVVVRIDAARLFKPYSSSPLAEADRVVALATQTLQQQPTLRLILEGHTDPTGEEEYNRLLTTKRARNLATLFPETAPTERLLIVGYGGLHPIATPASPLPSGAPMPAGCPNCRMELRFVW